MSCIAKYYREYFNLKFINKIAFAVYAVKIEFDVVSYSLYIF